MNFSNLNAFFTCTLHVSLRLIRWKVRASGLSYLMGRIFCRLVQLKKQILAVFCFTDANENWHKLVKHIQTVCWLLLINCLDVLYHFVVIQLKEKLQDYFPAFRHQPKLLRNQRSQIRLLCFHFTYLILVILNWIFEEHFPIQL